MAQIHNVEVTKTKRYVTDPEKGLTLIHDDHIQRGSASSVSFGDETYKVSSDGTFDVSNEAAAYFLKQPSWYEGPNPFVEDAPPVKSARTKASVAA